MGSVSATRINSNIVFSIAIYNMELEMILTKAQINKIEDEIYKIDKFGFHALQDYVQKLYMSKEDLDPTVFEWIIKATDIQMAMIMERTEVGCEVVMSELRVGEI